MDIEGSLTEIVKAGSEWIREVGEILAIARISRAAGARDYVLFDDPHGFATWASSLPPDTNLLVLKDYELSIRGPARAIVRQIPEEAEVEWLLIIEGVGYEGRDRGWECWGTSEARELLADYDNENVVAGRMPDWNPAVADHAPETLSAVVPRDDGTVRRGIY